MVVCAAGRGSAARGRDVQLAGGSSEVRRDRRGGDGHQSVRTVGC